MITHRSHEHRMSVWIWLGHGGWTDVLVSWFGSVGNVILGGVLEMKMGLDASIGACTAYGVQPTIGMTQ